MRRGHTVALALIAGVVLVAVLAGWAAAARTAEPGVLVLRGATVDEGDIRTRSLTLGVRRVGNADGVATVRFTVRPGTATSGADFVPRVGTLRFAQGVRTRRLVVAIVGDKEWERDETFRVVLSAAHGARLRNRQAIVTIRNDDTPVIAAAGDIACDPTSAEWRGADAARCQQRATAQLLADGSYAAVLALGDNQYEHGSLDSYRRSYDPSWGQVRAVTRPVPGNHEYETVRAAGYFDYFGAAAGDRSTGWYAYDVGDWHLIALNSNCDSVGGCGPGSPQERWLQADLAAHPARCTLAYWHHPRFSSGATHGSDRTTHALWRALEQAGADIVLSGHEHNYERFARQTASGAASDRGIRSFVVGTGGKSHYRFGAALANSEVRDATSFGVLELSLGPGRYSWRFVAATGSFTDSGSEACVR